MLYFNGIYPVIYQDGRFRSKRDSRKGGINFDHIIALLFL